MASQIESAFLREAGIELSQLVAAEKTVRAKNAHLVQAEAEIFTEALQLIRAVIGVAGPPPALQPKDVQRRACLLLSVSAFNALVVAWDSLMKGYYSVALGFFRFFPRSCFT